ncbi:MAG TPA: lysophospholipid acyltransferase family protein [Thermoanaerobaculia bacterium]|nr:lysophospholipid acyltransferase family protein [Thermoanaerobaculia bacterium]
MGATAPLRFLSGVLRSVLWFAQTSLSLSRSPLSGDEAGNFDHIYASRLSEGFRKYLNLRYEIFHEERLTAAQPCVYVVNHRSNLDVITLSRVFPLNTIVIGKKEVLRAPLFGTIFERGGNIAIDRKNSDNARAGFARAERAIVEMGRSIWVFPEGTRNHGRPLLPFRKGAFHLARNAGVPVVPIVCAVPDGWVSGRRMFLARETTVRIEVLEPIASDGFDSVDDFVKQAHDAMSEALVRLSAG